MSHTAHPDIHEHGLADDCPRCEEIAEKPTYDLDEEALRNLIERTLRNRFGNPTGLSDVPLEPPFGDYVSARSNAEAVAMAQVMNALERAGRVAEVAPDLLVRYLQERWRIVLPYVAQ